MGNGRRRYPGLGKAGPVDLGEKNEALRAALGMAGKVARCTMWRGAAWSGRYGGFNVA